MSTTIKIKIYTISLVKISHDISIKYRLNLDVVIYVTFQFRAAIIFFTSPMANPGFNPFGHVLVQFMMV